MNIQNILIIIVLIAVLSIVGYHFGAPQTLTPQLNEPLKINYTGAKQTVDVSGYDLVHVKVNGAGVDSNGGFISGNIDTSEINSLDVYVGQGDYSRTGRWGYYKGGDALDADYKYAGAGSTHIFADNGDFILYAGGGAGNYGGGAPGGEGDSSEYDAEGSGLGGNVVWGDGDNEYNDTYLKQVTSEKGGGNDYKNNEGDAEIIIEPVTESDTTTTCYHEDGTPENVSMSSDETCSDYNLYNEGDTTTLDCVDENGDSVSQTAELGESCLDYSLYKTDEETTESCYDDEGNSVDKDMHPWENCSDYGLLTTDDTYTLTCYYGDGTTEDKTMQEYEDCNDYDLYNSDEYTTITCYDDDGESTGINAHPWESCSEYNLYNPDDTQEKICYTEDGNGTNETMSPWESCSDYDLFAESHWDNLVCFDSNSEVIEVETEPGEETCSDVDLLSELPVQDAPASSSEPDVRYTPEDKPGEAPDNVMSGVRDRLREKLSGLRDKIKSFFGVFA